MVEALRLSALHRQQMLDHVLACLPEEACGLVGGFVAGAQAGLCQVVLPVTNLLHSRVRFRMAPEEQFRAFTWLEAQGLDLLAIFHSHPLGPDHPSVTDLAEFAYPGVLSLIWSPDATGWQVHAFSIEDGRADLLEIRPDLSNPSVV